MKTNKTFSVEIRDVHTQEIEYAASGFTTCSIALEDAATHILLFVPIHIRMRITMLADGFTVDRRRTEMKYRPSGQYRQKFHNGKVKNVAIMKLVSVDEYQHLYVVKIR